jgi:hypothetical protein
MSSENLMRVLSSDQHYLVITGDGPRLKSIGELIEASGKALFVMDLRKAGVHFHRLAKDYHRQFSMLEMAKIAGLDSKDTVETWYRHGLFRASILGSRGQGADRRFSYLDAFVIGVIGSLKRHGLRYKSLDKVTDLIYRTVGSTKVGTVPAEAN